MGAYAEMRRFRQEIGADIKNRLPGQNRYEKRLRERIPAPRKIDTKDTKKCENSPNKVERREIVEGIEIMEIAYFLAFGTHIQN